MDNKTDLEAILQNAVDELFALQSKAKEDHQKFLTESATLIKSSYTQLNDAVRMTSRAEKAALDSAEFAKQLNEVAHASYDGLRFWQRVSFWFAVGLLMVGVVLGLVYFSLGKQIANRQYQLDELQMRYESIDAALKKKIKNNME